MEDIDNINGAIERLVHALDVSETRDNQVSLILLKVVDQSTGIQNKTIRLLDDHLDNYGKRDIQVLFRKCKLDTLDDDEETKQYILIGNEVLERFKIITLKNLKGYNERPIMMVFKNQSYQRDLSELEEFISNRIIEYNVGHRSTFTDIIHYINKQTFFDFRKFNYDPFIIIFKNGIYNFEQKQFIQYEKPWQMYYFYELPHELDMNKRFYCPQFKRAVIKWIDKKTTKWHRNGKRKILLRDIFEAIGLCMTMNMSFRTAFLNYGPPRCGKTQFFNIICHIIGKNNISNTSLQRLSKNEFGADDLPYKILNYCGDLPSARVLDCGIFKSVTGGDTMVQIERKGKDKADFRAVCKFWSNANKVPRLGSWDDEATYDRFIMIAFLNQFEILDDDTIQDFCVEIINNKDEIQGIIHEAILGYYRLLKRGGFRQVLRENTMHTWNYMSNKVYAIVYDDCIGSTKERIEVGEFQEHYYDKYGPGDGKSYITRRMEELGFRKKEGREYGTSKKGYFYYGLKWSAKVQNEIDESGKIDIDKILADTKKVVRGELDDF